MRQRATQCADRLGTVPAAAALGVSARTLRHWRTERRRQKLTSARRGRMPLRCAVGVRNQVIHFLHHVAGPSVGLPALRCLFPKVPRCVLEDLLVRYRHLWRRRYVQRGFRLSWHQAGSVWAMDHSQALHPIDGIYPYLLAVRDLASGYQLAWHPTQTVTAEETLPILLSLFDEQGVPLVLKSDNGSAFTAEDLRHVMKQQKVSQLFSPPRRPAYNGALERSNGVLKTYTHQHALAEGHPFRWTSDDLEHARQLANTISRPWGHRGPTPEEAWQARESIGAEQRAEFRVALERQRAQADQDLGLDEQTTLRDSDQARRDRLALSRVLEELGYLTKQRVRRPPKKPKRMARAELARRTEKYEKKHKDVAHFGAQRLAKLVCRDRMRASTARTKGLVDSQHAPQQTASPHRERTNLSWSRRLITLLISLAKAAKITR